MLDVVECTLSNFMGIFFFNSKPVETSKIVN